MPAKIEIYVINLYNTKKFKSYVAQHGRIKWMITHNLV